MNDKMVLVALDMIGRRVDALPLAFLAARAAFTTETESPGASLTSEVILRGYDPSIANAHARMSIAAWPKILSALQLIIAGIAQRNAESKAKTKSSPPKEAKSEPTPAPKEHAPKQNAVDPLLDFSNDAMNGGGDGIPANAPHPYGKNTGRPFDAGAKRAKRQLDDAKFDAEQAEIEAAAKASAEAAAKAKANAKPVVPPAPTPFIPPAPSPANSTLRPPNADLDELFNPTPGGSQKSNQALADAFYAPPTPRKHVPMLADFGFHEPSPRKVNESDFYDAPTPRKPTPSFGDFYPQPPTQPLPSSWQSKVKRGFKRMQTHFGKGQRPASKVRDRKAKAAKGSRGGSGGLPASLAKAFGPVTLALGPLAILAHVVTQTASGFGLVLTAAKMLSLALAPLILPVFFSLAVAIANASEKLRQRLSPILDRLYAVVDPLITAFDYLLQGIVAVTAAIALEKAARLAASVASGTTSAASLLAGGGILGGLGGLWAGLGRVAGFLGKLALPVTAIMSAHEAATGGYYEESRKSGSSKLKAGAFAAGAGVLDVITSPARLFGHQGLSEWFKEKRGIPNLEDKTRDDTKLKMARELAFQMGTHGNIGDVAAINRNAQQSMMAMSPYEQEMLAENRKAVLRLEAIAANTQKPTMGRY